MNADVTSLVHLIQQSLLKFVDFIHLSCALKFRNGALSLCLRGLSYWEYVRRNSAQGSLIEHTMFFLFSVAVECRCIVLWRSRMQAIQTETLPDIIIILSGLILSPLGTAATTGQLYQPTMIDDDCGAICGMKFGGETEVLGENLPRATCPPQIPRDLTRA
jgi:hypothetical protein